MTFSSDASNGKSSPALRFLRYLIASLVLLASLGVLGGWWWLRRSLPQLDGVAALPALKEEVTVQRDNWGVPTIEARSLADAITTQGYVVAQDRLWQMDLLRRSAAGELSEVLGSSTLPLDKENRTLGLRGAAEASLAALPAEAREALGAYARGVNAYIEQHHDNLAWEFRVLRYQPKPWTPVDSLLIHGYMYKVLTETWEWELSRGKVTAIVGPLRARELFIVDSPLDHFIVGGEESAGRSAPAKKAAQGALHPGVQRALASAGHLLRRFDDQAEWRAGSNNWVVSGAHTGSGKPILANDTHLPNDVPAIWYMAHIKAPGYNTKGFALPGAPLIVIGHNERIAWGFTNNGADVQDLYLETFNPANPRQYRVNGKWMEAAVRQEVIKVKGAPDSPLEVLVTRHGPVVHRDSGGAYALRWTALEPLGLGMGYGMLGTAQNWTEFLGVMRTVAGPAQNAVYADVDGNIGFIVASRIPVRRKGDGALPVPGDTDDFAWTGYIPFEQLPVSFNPPAGVIATANARVVGPGYRPYLTDRWYDPYRTHRIYQLLARARGKLRPADNIAFQADIYSAPHVFIEQQVLAAAKYAQPRDPRTVEYLTYMPQWDGRALANSRFMPFLEFTRREILRELLRARIGPQFTVYTWSRRNVLLERILRERPPDWLPRGHADYDEFIMACADMAVKRLEEEARLTSIANPEQPESWRWGQFTELRMLHPFGRSGFLRRHLSVAGVAQNGAGSSVKQTGNTFGPAMRFVADLSNWDNSLMNITLGQSGHYLSPHFRDQFPAWFNGAGIPSPFSPSAQAAARAHSMRLVPRL